jgi:hypothetical protein
MAAQDILDTLRRDGWSVAVHNDYKLAGEPHTFWLFTHPSGIWAMGEASTDLGALRCAQLQAAERLARQRQLLSQ